MDELLAAWEIEEGADVRELVASAQDAKIAKPTLRLRLVASRGDSITVQVASGRPPATGTLVYVAWRGPYRLARCERWPGDQELLLLEAWPRR